MGWMLGITYEFRGLENIDTKKGGVTILNHQSGLDLICKNFIDYFQHFNNLIKFAVIAKLYPHLGRATVVVKKEIFYLCPPIGLASWLWGTLFINRADRKSAHALINKQEKEITDNQSKLVLFPEGTRNETETLLPFKKGPFHVAIASQTGVQPVVVSKYYYFDSKKLIFGRGHSVIKILPEISTKGMTKDDIDGLIDRTQSLMQEEYTKLSKEVYASMHNEG